MISRLLERQIHAQLARYPAVVLSGARQTGKTTLAKAFEGRYFDLENPQDQLRLESSTPDAADLRRLQDRATLVGADRIALISRTAEPVCGKAVASLNLAAALDWLMG